MNGAINKLLIVAGSGTYPACIARGARAAGVAEICMVALRGATDRATARLADDVRWFGIGEVAALFDWASSRGVDGAIMAGQIPPLALFRTRFDSLARTWLSELPVKNAHTIFGKVLSEFEARGVRTLPASCYMDAYMPGVGVQGARAPDARELADIRHGMTVASDMGRHDVGQTILVKEGMVLAVEAFEGTSAAILRGGKLGGAGAVIVKAAREGHDMRFDIPVIGAKTIRVLKRAKISAFAYQAGRLVMLERAQVLAAADRLGIAVIGMETDLPAAPLRP